MRKNKIFIFVILALILGLTGCTNNLDSEKLKIEEDNLKVQTILNSFDKSCEQAKEFDVLFDNLMQLEYDNVAEELLDESTELKTYIYPDIDFFSVFLSLRGEIEKDKELGYNTEIKKHHLLNDEDGSLEELVTIQTANNEFYLYLDWSGGLINSIRVYRGE